MANSIFAICIFLVFSLSTTGGAYAFDPEDKTNDRYEHLHDDDKSLKDKKDRRRKKRDEKKLDRRDDDDHRDDEDDKDDDRDPFKKLKKDWLNDFIDTDFSKTKFKDFTLEDKRRDKRDSDGRDVHKRDDDKTDSDDDGDDDKDIKVDDSDDRDDDKSDDDKSDDVGWFSLDLKNGIGSDDRDKLIDTVKDLTKRDYRWLHDWVPARVDRLHQGAFEKEPDNGFPVPYRLNGHLDIQRKLPWEKE